MESSCYGQKRIEKIGDVYVTVGDGNGDGAIQKQ